MLHVSTRLVPATASLVGWCAATLSQPALATERYQVRPESTYALTQTPPCADEPMPVASGNLVGGLQTCEIIAPGAQQPMGVYDPLGWLSLSGECDYTITHSPLGDTQRLIFTVRQFSGDYRLDSGILPFGVGQPVHLEGFVGDACEYVQLDLVIEHRCLVDMDDGTMTGTPDGGVTVDDLLYYLYLFSEGLPQADLDCYGDWGCPDCSTNSIDDLLYFLYRFEAGC